MRTMLYEAAQAMMRSKKWSLLKAWAMQIVVFRKWHSLFASKIQRIRPEISMICWESTSEVASGRPRRWVPNCGGACFPPAPNDLCCDRSRYFWEPL
jgi:hypothetical protein